MRVLLYLRTSTAGQAKLGTIEAQRQALPALAAARGWTIVETVEDEGRSGRRLAGRGLGGVLERIEAGELVIDAILAADTSRLIRPDPNDLQSQMDAVLIRHVLRSCKVCLLDGQGEETRYDGSTLFGDLRQAIDSEEWQKLRTRTVEGRRVAIRAGRPGQGRVPWGLRFRRFDNGRDGAWELVPDQAEIVRSIYRWYVEDRMGSSMIASRLSADGHAAPGGGKWHPASILRMIRKEAYTGVFRQKIGGQTFETPVPPVVPRATWERAQAIKGRRGNKAAKKMTTTALLRGLATCGHCGRAVVGSSQMRASGRVVYYRCARRHAHGWQPCDLRSFRAAELDALIWAEVEELLLTPHCLAVAAKVTDDAKQAGGLEAEVAHLRKLVCRLDGLVADTMRMWRRGKLTEEQRDDAVAETNREIGAVKRNLELGEKRLAKSVRAKTLARSLEDVAATLREAVQTADAEGRNSILQTLCPTKDFGFVLERADDETIVWRGNLCLHVEEMAVRIGVGDVA